MPPTVPVNTATPTIRPQPTSAEELAALLESITTTYGIGFAIPEEWQPASIDQLFELYSYLLNIEASFEQAAVLLHYFSRATDDVSPQAFFNELYGALSITIDRTTQPLAPSGAQTLVVENEAIDAQYILQLSPQGMSMGFPILRELAFIMNNALGNAPLAQFSEQLGGGTVGETYQPGLGYPGNESLFPYAFTAQADFQDALARMLSGQLSPSASPERYAFFVERLPFWVEALGRTTPTADQ